MLYIYTVNVIPPKQYPTTATAGGHFSTWGVCTPSKGSVKTLLRDGEPRVMTADSVGGSPLIHHCQGV